jgi:IPT/TIG domain
MTTPSIRLTEEIPDMNRIFTGKRRVALGAVATVGIAAAAIGVGSGAANAAALPATLSATSGPSGGTNTLSITVASAKFATGAAVEFQVATACSAAYAASATVTATAGVAVASVVKVLSSTKIAVTVPSTVALVSPQTTANFLVCVYPGTNTTTSLLAANGHYSIAAKPTATALTPASGPALGGSTITVTGTNFITGLTATLGGLALTSINILSATSFTATTPAHAAASNLALAVTTTGGTVTRANSFSYSNGIVISPNTTPTATAATDVDVQGVGFSTLDFTTTDGTTPDNNAAHIYLVDGVYDPTAASAVKTKPEVGECLNALVISDTELICTLNTAHAYGTGGSAAIGNGLYTLSVVTDGGVDVQAGGTGYTGGSVTAGADPNYAQSIISSGSAFVVAPY